MGFKRILTQTVGGRPNVYWNPDGEEEQQAHFAQLIPTQLLQRERGSLTTSNIGHGHSFPMDTFNWNIGKLAHRIRTKKQIVIQSDNAT